MLRRESLRGVACYPMKQRHLRLGNETDFVTKFDNEAGFARLRAWIP